MLPSGPTFNYTVPSFVISSHSSRLFQMSMAIRRTLFCTIFFASFNFDTFTAVNASSAPLCHLSSLQFDSCTACDKLTANVREH